jgi:putative peptidoglycan binding protein
MASYQIGSVGPEVKRLQARLGELGFYRGPVDGVFGGGTDAAVRAMQRAKRLAVDGVVGPRTWSTLFDEKRPPSPAVRTDSLARRCLALTGSFETGTAAPDCFAGLSGDFDGQGISFGVCQWNLGQQSLQPLLLKMDAGSRPVMKQVFGDRYDELMAVLGEPHEDQLEWARQHQTPKHELFEPWRGYLKTLGRTEEFQAIEEAAAQGLYRTALKECRAFAVTSERAAALLFDIYVQNGGFKATTRATIEGALARLPTAGNAQQREVARLRTIANLRADASKEQWREDVRSRKLCIAEGGGVVHGRRFDLEGDFGIGIRNAE